MNELQSTIQASRQLFNIDMQSLKEQVSNGKCGGERIWTRKKSKQSANSRHAAREGHWSKTLEEKMV